MGIVRMGPPWELIHFLREQTSLTTFVETGTYYGRTSAKAAEFFDKVITFEFAKELYEEAKQTHQDRQNIEFIFGHSGEALSGVMDKLENPALFWLDSHWSGGNTYGDDDECPLIDELKAIAQSSLQHVILIDDARLFTSPPPQPHKIEVWPNLMDIIHEFDAFSHPMSVSIQEDVIIAVPESLKETTLNYLQESNTRAWRNHSKSVKESKIEKGWKLTNEGVGLMSQHVVTLMKNRVAKVVRR